MNSIPECPDKGESEEEVARRRDEVIKRMLATPPQPKAKTNKKAPKT